MTANTAHAPLTAPVTLLRPQAEAVNEEPATPTLESLQQQINEVRENDFKIYDELHEEHDANLKTLNRKSRGTTRANAELAALKRYVDKLAEKINTATDVEPEILLKWQEDLNRASRRVGSLFDELAEDVRVLQLEVAGHTGQLAEHTGQLADHALKIDDTNDKVVVIDSHVKSMQEKMETPKAFIIIAVIASVVTWIVVSLIWGSFDHSPADLVLKDGTKIEQTSQLNSPFITILFGFMFAAVVFVIFWMFAPKRIIKKTEAGSSTSVSSVKETTDAPSSPDTKVIMTSPGADSVRS
jgi:hypothetical protein